VLTGLPVISRKRFSDPIRHVDFATGCCLMLPAALFSRLGGFDENYFMYSEDVDLCFRARRVSAQVLVVNRHLVHHVGSGEKGRYSDLYLYEGTRNRLLCLRRHNLGILPIGIAYTLLKYGVFRTVQLAVHSEHPLRQICAAWRGLAEGLIGEPRSIENVVRQ
jgi:GT2 family glycosyltransferase